MTPRLVVPRRSDRRYTAAATSLAVEYLQPALQQLGPDRRTSRRFPIELLAELCIGQKSIVARTVNISSGGLLLSCFPDDLRTRRRVRVRLTNWPTAPKGRKITLVVIGSIVRIEPGLVAVRRASHEFVED
jgi:hypothetical protein